MTASLKTINGIVIILAVFCFHSVSFAQEITEENYHKADKMIWDKYYMDIDTVRAAIKKHPEKKDSLKVVLNELFEIVNKCNCDTAIKYASVPSGLQRLFWVRLQLSKDTLLSVLKRLPPEMRVSPYGKSILLHINTVQIEENSRYYDFKTTNSDGNEFQLSSLKGKNILLLYGGLSCFGEGGLNYLKKLYKETSRDSFQIVIYCPCSDLNELKELKRKYPSDIYYVSDFLQDHTPVKIVYGAQARPTCFLINKEGTVVVKSVGLPEEEINRLKEDNKL